MLLGYDAAGRCPLLVHGGCSIYPDRPRTCRTYDCRVFTAAGVTPDKPLIAERVRSWSFTYDDEVSRSLHEAVVAAAGGVDGPSATAVAVRAVATVLDEA